MNGQWGDIHPEAARRLQAMVDAANAMEADRGGRKQHLVPASYLSRWSVDGLVRVTDVEARSSYSVGPAKAGRETDFYRLEADGIDPSEVPPLLLEALLSRLEAGAKARIDMLLAGQDPTPDVGQLLVSFLAMQVTRGRAFRAEMRAVTHELTRREVASLTEAEVRRRLAADGVATAEEKVAAAMDGLAKLKAGEWVMTPQDAMLAGLAMQVADELVPHLLFRHWLVYDTPPVLVTCDEPVVAIGGPETPREQVSGYEHAPVVLFPLTPSKLLVLRRLDLEPELDLSLNEAEVAEINRELVASSTRWVFEQPSSSVGMDTEVPPQAAPLGTEDVASGLVDNERVEVLRQFRPSRWGAAPETPWPVAHWWIQWPAPDGNRVEPSA